MTRQQIDFMNERAIVVCGEGWNPGVIGLAASRLVEKYKWPTILLSRDGDICVGSARSIPGVNIHEAMSTCRDLFIRFGGHAQAAGLTIEAKNVPEFKRRLSEAIREQAAPEAFIPTEEYDLELELSEMTEAFVDAFSAMQPTGFGNPAPVFCVRGVHTTDVRTIGKDGAHLRMRLAQGSDMRSAIGFRMGDRAANLPEVIEAIITLSINVWQDKRSVQCELRQMQAYMPGKAFIAECQRQSEKISNAMLSTLCLPDQKAENIERMTLEQAKTALASEFEKGYQGILIGVHTLAALKLLNVHLAVMHAQLDYVLEKTEDIRGFNTLVMVPDWANIAFSPRLIVAMDGMLSDGERVLVKEKFPKARVIEVVQSNHGCLEELTVCNRRLGEEIIAKRNARPAPEPNDRGSIMMVTATDLPVSDRQLRRIIKRCSVGLARCGSYFGHGSGDVMIGFTTANRMPAGGMHRVVTQQVLTEHTLELAFRAIAEATQEAVLNSLCCADAVTAEDGRVFESIATYL